ncbi:prepilin-type N-terminal cleavage/methylation domain-containing protein [Planctomycetales bacterium]|nr:prepilin-type N-terminal cleavage/methylation domain-containing protein [Planctomycetales bacterium]
MQCTNHLKQFALSVHNFHDTILELPKANFTRVAKPYAFAGVTTGSNWTRWNTGFGTGTDAGQPNCKAYGWLVELLPFMEQQSRYQNFLRAMEMNSALNKQTATIASGVDNPFIGYVGPWVCPSDPNGQPITGTFSRGSYHACLGDVGFNDLNTESNYGSGNNFMDTRGAFVFGFSLTRDFASVTDGLSNTIFFAEAVISEYSGTTDIFARGGVVPSVVQAPGQTRSKCMATKVGNTLTSAIDVSGTTAAGIGRRAFAAGDPVFSLFATLSPPNYPTCARGTTAGSSTVTASSTHSGGINAALGDGSVRFISETINANNTPAVDTIPTYGSSSGQSPWGVWGAYGTVGGSESQAL